jgi:hypothetical protein
MPDPDPLDPDPPPPPPPYLATIFPMRFVDVVAERLAALMTDHRLEKRPVSTIDPSKTICVFPEDWATDENERLMGYSFSEPVLSTYRLIIENLVIHGDSTVGRSEFSVASKSVRAILYRDDVLHVSLAGLSEVFMGSVERVKKFTVPKQQFLSAGRDVGFYYLCRTELKIETETMPQ